MNNYEIDTFLTRPSTLHPKACQTKDINYFYTLVELFIDIHMNSEKYQQNRIHQTRPETTLHKTR